MQNLSSAAPTRWDRKRTRLAARAHYAAIAARDGNWCRGCGRADDQLHVDHLLPLSRGGNSDQSNLALLCRSCNARKSTKTWDEWITYEHGKAIDEDAFRSHWSWPSRQTVA